MLEDNCAAVERITYTSPFSEEEMGERKTELANIDLDMAALEEEKKAFMQAYKDKLKPKKERKKTLLTDIKRGYEEITDECFKFMDRNTRTTIWLKNVRWRHKRCKKQSSRTWNLLVRRDKL